MCECMHVCMNVGRHVCSSDSRGESIKMRRVMMIPNS